MPLNLNPLPDRILQALYRNSLSAFIEKCFGIVSSGDTYLHNWHIDVIAQHLEACADGRIKRLIISVPPRYMKSICASVALPAWLLGLDPTQKIIAVSYSHELSLKHSLDCKSVMEHPFYRETFPRARLSGKRSTQTEYATTLGGYRMATSTGGTLTGRGADILILDDPIKPMEAFSDVGRSSVNAWYDNTLYSRLNDKKNGCIIIIMQRLHEDDLIGHVLAQEDWTYVKIPALAELQEEICVAPRCIKPYRIMRQPGDALHPARETAEQLHTLKTTIMGGYVFAAQYQQEPAPLGGGMIKRGWLRTYAALPDERPMRIVISWDTASKAEEIHDFSVATVWHEYKQGYYLIEVVRKRLEFPDLRREILALADKHRPHAVLIEDKGSGTNLIQELRRESRHPIIDIMPEGDKIMRAMSQTPHMEGGRVYLPAAAQWLADFENELMKFPNSKNDDQVDSLTQALKWMSAPATWGVA